MKKKREDEDEIRKKKIIKTIIDIVHHSYEQWSQFLLDSSQKCPAAHCGRRKPHNIFL